MLCLQQIALFPKGERRRQSLDGRKDLSILNVMFDSTILGVFWCSSEYLGNPSKTWANFSKPSPTQYFAGNAKSKTFQDGETKIYFHGIIFLILNISFLFPERKIKCILGKELHIQSIQLLAKLYFVSWVQLQQCMLLL